MTFDAELREVTERIAAPLQNSQAHTESAFLFRVRDEWFGVPSAVCERAIDSCIVHSVPHRRGGILLGIGSVEGDLVPVVSLAALLHPRGDVGATVTERVLLIGWRQGRFAAPVDDVHGVHRYHPDELLPPPATLAASSAFVSGLLSWRSHSVGLLNPARLFDGLVRGVA